MKTRKPPQWYVEWNKETGNYHVLKDGFCDSIHRTKIDALGRIVEIDEKEKQP